MKIVNFCSFFNKRKENRTEWHRPILVLIALFVFSTQIWAQQQVALQGQVVDEAGDAIIGASVSLDKSSKGTITDIDGNFTLDVPSNGIIVVSYLGYKTQQIPVNNQKKIKITLKENLSDLDEVVVIGYGAVKKRDLTGAVASVKDKEITLNPKSNAIEGIQGRIAGFDITRTSSKAGSEPTMQLRGNRTLLENSNGLRESKPLILIDGMPGDYATINPNDIASIEVLKDASSTAVYGVAGANGVVLISTKNAEKGKPKVNFNAYYGINGWAKTPKVRMKESYLQLRRDAYAATGVWTSPADDDKIFRSEQEMLAAQNGEWVNWVDEIIKNGTEQNYSLSVSSATDNTTAYLSLNFNNEQGIYKNDNNKIYSIKTKLEQRINKYVSIGGDVSVAYSINNARKGLMTKAMSAIPLGQPYNEDGSINLSPIAGSSEPTLLADLQSGVYANQRRRTNVVANAYVNITPINGLVFKSLINTVLDNRTTGVYRGVDSFDGLNGGWSKSQASKQSYNRYNYQWDNILTYNLNLQKKHDIIFTGVTSWAYKQSDLTLASAQGVPFDKYSYHNLGSGDVFSNQSEYNMNKMFSVLGRVNYSYLGRYLLSASMRWDGSSRLAYGSQWKTFPAISAGWRISDENFMESTKTWLDNLKLRLGYGVTGNDNIDDYAAESSYESSQIGIGTGQAGSLLFGKYLANTTLTWERTYGSNIGLDINILKNRVNLAMEFYWTKTKGLLFDRQMPSHMGQYYPGTPYLMAVNYGELKNKGIEITLNTVNVTTKDFTWSSTLTFAHNNEKISSLPGGIDEMVFTNKNTIFKVGEPGTSYYNYKVLGIWQNNEADEAAIYGKNPGDVKVATRVKQDENGYFYINDAGDRVVVDKNNKYDYSPADYQVLGHDNPNWTGGFQNNFRYKDFDLSIFIYARYGQMIKYATLTSFDPSGIKNSPAYFNYWTPTNPSNDFPAAKANTSFSSYEGSSGIQFVNGSFWKVKNITLGYTVPRKLLQKMGIENLRVYSTITNPFVIAKSHLLKDYDPEMNGNDDYPLTKQLVFGVNLTF